MELSEHLARIEGELLATQVAIRGLILSHGEPHHALDCVTLQLERFVARALQGTTSDATIDGIARARKRLLPSAGDLPPPA